MTQAAVLAQMGNTNQTFRNRIINGAMMVAQRGTTAVTQTTTGTDFPVDRFVIVGTTTSKFTGQQNAGSITPPAGFTNYLGCTSSSAYAVTASDFFLINHFVEGFNVADFGWGTAAAQSVTLSFWVRSSLTGTFGGSLTNSANNRAYPYSYTISSANTWEYKTITITGDTTGTWLTDNGRGIGVRWSMGAGSTYSGTAGAWSGTLYYSATGATSVVGTNGATFYITGVQLEAGTTATPFEFRQYGTELALCQRYYETSTVYVVANTAAYTPFVFPYTTKRAAPTVTTPSMPSTVSGSNAGVNNYSGFFTLSTTGSAIVTATVSAEL